MLKLAVTGSIGMGKTTLAGLFGEQDIPVFSADGEIAKLYHTGGGGAAALALVFPTAIHDDQVNREELRRIVERDPENYQILERILHPVIRQCEEAFTTKQEKSGAWLAVYDIPLLLESGGKERFDVIMVATASAAEQKRRVLAREGMNEKRFFTILARQTPDDQKRQQADFVIETENGLCAARSDIKQILQKLKAKYARNCS